MTIKYKYLAKTDLQRVLESKKDIAISFNVCYNITNYGKMR